MVKTPPFHGDNMGSNPVGVTTFLQDIGCICSRFSCIYNNLNRRLTDDEYDDVIKYALELGVTNAFIQEGETAVESFIPDFNTNVIV